MRMKTTMCINRVSQVRPPVNIATTEQLQAKQTTLCLKNALNLASCSSFDKHGLNLTILGK